MSSTLDERVALNAWRGTLGFFTQTEGLFGQSLIQGGGLLKTTALLQGATPFLRGREREQAFSSPIVAIGGAVMIEERRTLRKVRQFTLEASSRTALD